MDVQLLIILEDLNLQMQEPYEAAILKYHDGSMTFLIFFFLQFIDKLNRSASFSMSLALILILTYLFLDPYVSSCQHFQRNHFRPSPVFMVLLKILIYYRITIYSYCRLLRIESKNDTSFSRNNVTFTAHKSRV